MIRGNRDYIRCVTACWAHLDGLKHLQGKRVLVTGASGLIGSHLVDVLLEVEGVAVTACGRSRIRLEERFGGEKSRLRFCEWDYISPLPQGLPAFDYIVHAAGGAHPAAFATDPVGVMETNLLGTRYLLNMLRACGEGRFLLVSSGEVYGQGDEDTAAFNEQYSGRMDSTDPRSCYPISKRAAETLCAAFLAQYGADSVIARPCHVYGPTQTASDSRVSAQFLRLAAERRDIVMKSDGAQVRGYCHVSDCVSGLIACMLKGKSGEAYNIADRKGVVSIRQLAELCAGAGGVSVIMEMPEQFEATGYSKVTRAVLDASKLEAIGWRAVTPLEMGISDTIEILRGETKQLIK